MTAEEIKNAAPGLGAVVHSGSQVLWLKEIAYQLALLNEKADKVDQQ